MRVVPEDAITIYVNMLNAEYDYAITERAIERLREERGEKGPEELAIRLKRGVVREPFAGGLIQFKVRERKDGKN